MGDNLDVLPLTAQLLLPGGNAAGKPVVIGDYFPSTRCLGHIVLVHIVGQHPVGGEVARNLGYGVLDIADPDWREA